LVKCTQKAISQVEEYFSSCKHYSHIFEGSRILLSATILTRILWSTTCWLAFLPNECPKRTSENTQNPFLEEHYSWPSVILLFI